MNFAQIIESEELMEKHRGKKACTHKGCRQRNSNLLYCQASRAHGAQPQLYILAVSSSSFVNY